MIESDGDPTTDSSDEEEIIDDGKEKEPSSVPFHFLKTGLLLDSYLFVKSLSLFPGKSKKEGILITHKMFKFQKNNASRDYSTWWYTCSHKSTHGCNARAIINRKEFTGDDGELWVKNVLVEVSTPEVNKLNGFRV